MSTTDALTAQIIKLQVEDETFGLLFRALYEFMDRTIDEFYFDIPELPAPFLSLEKERGNMTRGSYVPADTVRLQHRINLNPFVLKDGVDAARTLAHELVHHWQFAQTGQTGHGQDFHERMRNYGLKTVGKNGHCIGTMDDDSTWPDWMIANEDLHLEKFILPGSEKGKPRKLLKYECQQCGASFRCRTFRNALCLDCEEVFVLVD